jgi:excisionase family DNA binding protein
MDNPRNTDCISTQEAAHILNTSSEYLIELIESHQVTSTIMDGEQKVSRQEVLNYKERIDGRRMQILDELTAQTEELGMGY